MKKFVVLLLITAIFGSMAFNYAPQTENYEATVNAPVYQKIDKDLANDLNAAGVKIKPEKNTFMNGKSHIKPTNLETIEPLDMRGLNNKGIAILVDFKTNEDGTSAVPGVDYDRIPARYFDDLLNGTTYNPYDIKMFEWIIEGMDDSDVSKKQTLKNYYDEVSYNQYGIDIEVVDWVTLPESYEYYLGQDEDYFSNENGDAKNWELVKHAIEAAKANGINFSDYAIEAEAGEFWLQQDKDGYASDGSFYIDVDGTEITKFVPNVFIIHRGTGAEYSRDPEIIWSHKWDIMSAQYYGHYYETGEYYTDEEYVEALNYVVADGVVVNTYNIVPEVGQDISGYLSTLLPDTFGPDYTGRAASPAYPGVYAHEFGHVLGLPDQYDYGYDSEGTGLFTLMAGGSYGSNVTAEQTVNGRWFTGNSPVHMDAWSKYYLGFVNPTVITENTILTLESVTNSPDIYKIDVPGSNGTEYFLLENRQLEGFDKGFIADGDIHGLVVYHIVDEVLIKSFGRPNEVASPTANHKTNKYRDASGISHYAISVLQADGKYDLENGNNEGDAFDTFPGHGGVHNLLAKGAKVNTDSLKMWEKGSNNTGINILNIVEHDDGTITCEVVFE
ncbi:MAG: M6 family metalloprotease domain-containing protein [Clostridiales bacterium]|nr:M6 family metalloprotease domain-containing protein [Clostridiales bacterium]